ncbi:cation:proton antiporter [Campylobacter corcagiensis]|uniref:Cation:proton antiporter n=1 Tax=Campylobacter corcagiensis TaxID=1448857 RepID=A0A7M1LHG2_9BACT|nr:cation:proton antiporter [Campylobacter corcagiensis]QKF65391.1 sodium:proton exchanger family protein [Campylobacter corcagiensis]QOQ88032.1 cation:proton antiporter [Campylobacter corcagiensis]
MNELLILITLAFIIFASPYVATFIKLPTSATEILLGIILGTIGLLPDSQSFKTVADVGFYYLMFLAGMKVDLRVLLRTDKLTLNNTLLFLAASYALAGLFIYIFSLNLIYLIVLPIMSVGILSTLYKEYGNDTKWLNTAMFVGVVGEVISIALLTVFGAYIENGFGVKLFINLGALIGFLVVVGLIFRWVDVFFWWFPDTKKALMPQFDKNEKDIRLSISLLCIVIAVMIILKLKIVIGAFIAGMFIPTFFGYKKDLPAKLESFGFGFLVPIFFAYIGSTVNLSVLFNPIVAKSVVFLTILMLLIRVVPAFVFYKELQSIKEVLLYGVSLGMPLTLLIATATVGYGSGYIGSDAYYSMVLASVLQAIICTTLIKIIYDSKI